MYLLKETARTVMSACGTFVSFVCGIGVFVVSSAALWERLTADYSIYSVLPLKMESQ